MTVEPLEKGFLINVFSDRSCPGLLVSILEAFEELGLNVLEARVSCTDSFRLQAVGGEVRFIFIDMYHVYVRTYLYPSKHTNKSELPAGLMFMRHTSTKAAKCD